VYTIDITFNILPKMVDYVASMMRAHMQNCIDKERCVCHSPKSKLLTMCLELWCLKICVVRASTVGNWASKPSIAHKSKGGQ